MIMVGLSHTDVQLDDAPTMQKHSRAWHSGSKPISRVQLTIHTEKNVCKTLEEDP